VHHGEQVVQTIKTFEATWRPAGGRIRVVIVWEDDGRLAYFWTDPTMPAVSILEAMADRGTIEQLFKDVKEVWGAGQQQVRNVYASIGAFTVTLVLFSGVEVWAWACDEEALVDRSRCPWDQEKRRASHADKRKALQRLILREEIRAAAGGRVELEELSRISQKVQIQTQTRDFHPDTQCSAIPSFHWKGSEDIRSSNA
jgi:hypothetical protein